VKLKTLALAGTAGLVLSVAATGIAVADPNGAPTFRQLAGVGSDTTDFVLQGLSDVVVSSTGEKLIGSYNAQGTPTIKTKATGCEFARPNGSSAGRAALLASLNSSSSTFGCIDFARSSSLNLAATPAGSELTYIPFATDSLTYAVNINSSIPRDLSLDELKAIYRCEVAGMNPLIPQAGSGTRQSFLQLVGLTETTKGACVKDTNNGQPVQEHDGRAITGPNDIAAFSVSQYIAQSFGAQTDRRGSATLGALDGKLPFTLNTDTTGARKVYNIVPTARLSTQPTQDVFVGPSSKVCSATRTIQRFGFAVASDCGSTTNRTPTS
jgi:ABC-type phosphate transport system substrate-binding protein